MRKTKIICTLGPATNGKRYVATIDQKRGGRFSIEYEPRRPSLGARNCAANPAARGRDRPVRLESCSIRRVLPFALAISKTDLHLKPDDILELTVGGAKSEERYSVDVNYEGIIDDVSVGDTILVDNGMLRLVVLEKRRDRIRCKVVTPGTLGSRRHD